MRKNVLRIKKCIENGGSSERVGSASGEVSGWMPCNGTSPLKTPEKRVPGRWKGKHGRPCIPGLPGAGCTCGKGPEREARTSRHVRVRKLPVGGLLVLNFNYTSKHW